jgi:hypothetical protein
VRGLLRFSTGKAGLQLQAGGTARDGGGLRAERKSHFVQKITRFFVVKIDPSPEISPPQRNFSLGQDDPLFVHFCDNINRELVYTIETAGLEFHPV